MLLQLSPAARQAAVGSMQLPLSSSAPHMASPAAVELRRVALPALLCASLQQLLAHAGCVHAHCIV